LVGFVDFVGGFGWFCWWFWVVLGGFGWFRVLVTTMAVAKHPVTHFKCKYFLL